VKFKDAFQDIQRRWKESSIARRTERGRRAYRASGEVLYPRLYGYRRTAVGIEIIESEALVIRSILTMLADGKSVESVKHLLDARNLRNRSNNLFTQREIIEMPKPAYAGMIETTSGRWVKSNHYPPITSDAEIVVRKARRAVEKLSEEQDFPLPGFQEGLFLTSKTAGWCPNTWQGVLDGFSQSR
jgi:hypothetical protein